MEKAVFLSDVVDLNTGEVLFEAGRERSGRLGRRAPGARHQGGRDHLPGVGPGQRHPAQHDPQGHPKTEAAIIEIYRRMRPGDPPTSSRPRTCSKGCSSTPKYDFSRVGRFKFNIKLELDYAGHARP